MCGKAMETILYINASTASEALRRKLAGIRRYARVRKWNVQAVLDVHGAMAVAKSRREFKPVGVIVESCNAGGIAWREHAGKAGRVPVVYLDPDPKTLKDSDAAVVHDQAATARMALGVFEGLRLERVAYAGWFSRRFWAEARGDAFQSAAAAAGLECDSFRPDFDDRCGEERYAEELAAWLGSLRSPAGLFAANDRIASLVLAACRLHDIAVPQRLAVLGVDNDETRCENEMPSLTSIQLDFEQAGYEAGELLDALASGREGEGARRSFGPLGVISRESTRAFQRLNPRIVAAIDLIRERACNGLRAADVVRTIGGSRRLAEMRFREATGKSILEEIQRVRFDKVFCLLAGSEMPLGAIADFCGYKSSETLRRLFLRRTGVSMGEWRRAHGGLRKRL